MASASTLPSLYQGVEKGSFGYKMLATMGWKEGQGLGANKQGIIEHVKVKKKQDALGVGAAEHVHKLRDWTTGMVGFDAILTGLKEISRAPHSSSSSSDHGSSSSEGHESGYASDSDTSVEVQKNSSKIAAAAAVGFKGGDISTDKLLNKKQKKRKLGASVASDSISKKKAKDLNSNKKRKKAGATPAAGKSSTTSKQTASAAAAAAASNVSDTSSSESDSDADSDPSSQPAAAAAVRPNNSTGKAATHLGRYQKREKAKTVRNYSATDLAAILGLPGNAPGAPTAEGAAGWTAAAGISTPNGAAASSSSSSSDDSGSSGDRSESDHDSSDQRLRPTTPPGSDTPPVRVSVSQQRQGLGSGSSDSPDPAAAAEDAGTGSSGSWWRSVFVRADRGAGNVIGSGGKKRINVRGFLEEDQTNLYMQAHEAAVKNKQGLGRSAMPKKVAGARWQGKKTKLGSDSEDEQQQQQQQQQQVKKQQQPEQEEEAAVAGAGRQSHTKNEITIVMPIRRSQQQQLGVCGVQQQQQIGGVQQQQQQQRDGKQKRKQERDCNGSGVKVKHKAQQQQAAAESDKAAAAAAAALATPSSRKKQKKSDQQRQVQHTAVKPSPSTAAAAGSRKVRWAKLAAKILEGAPKKRMRVQKLHKKVVAAAGYDVDAPGVDSEKLYQQMLGKLRKAEGLEVCDKYVAMA